MFRNTQVKKIFALVLQKNALNDTSVKILSIKDKKYRINVPQNYQ